LKSLVKHGEWQAFVAANFPDRSLRDCQRCMQFAGAADPEQAEREAKDAEAERQRIARAEAAAEQARIAAHAETEKRQTDPPSGAFDALAVITEARAAPVGWGDALPWAVPIADPVPVSAGPIIGTGEPVRPVSVLAEANRADKAKTRLIEALQKDAAEIEALVKTKRFAALREFLDLSQAERADLLELLDDGEIYWLGLPKHVCPDQDDALADAAE
jgi:hypothetical protein